MRISEECPPRRSDWEIFYLRNSLSAEAPCLYKYVNKSANTENSKEKNVTRGQKWKQAKIE